MSDYNKGMNRNEIANVLMSDPITAKWYKGVFCSDEIPVLRERSAIVINTDDSTKPGSHWIAVFVENKDTIEMFDSFGRSPHAFGENISSFTSNYKYVLHNDIWFQHPDSIVCGVYCIYYIWMKSRGIALFQIQERLKGNVSRDIEFSEKMTKWKRDMTSAQSDRYYYE